MLVYVDAISSGTQASHRSLLCCLIMAGKDGVSLSFLSSSEDTEKTRVKHVTNVKSLQEAESLIKATIWRTSDSSERLLNIKVASSLSVRGEYRVEMVFESLRQVASQEKASKNTSQPVWLEEYEQASTDLLYQTPKGKLLPVEILEASAKDLALPAVMKLYYCSSSSYMNKVIQEALLQVRVSSAYTCKLLNLYISRGSIHLFEVKLMMEKLEGDLEVDIKHRAQKNNHYSEGELRYILKCVAEALLYAKLRVRVT